MSDGHAVLLDAPGEPGKRHQIAKLGDFHHGTYGDFSITEPEVRSWQANLSKLPGQKAVIDLDHRSERSPRNSEAAGWINGIDIEGERVMANIEWTPMGETAIRERRYQFFSPVYGPYSDDKGDTHPDTLVSAALTNKPALNLPTISLASPERLAAALEPTILLEQTELDVSADERKLALKEGNSLPDGSYPIRNTAQLHSAAILAASGHGNAAAAKKLIARRAKELGVDLKTLPGFGKKEADSPPPMQEVLKALDLADDADEATVLAAVTSLIEKATEPESTKTLEQQAKEDGKIVLDAEQYRTLDAGAKAGVAAQRELAEQRFDHAFTKALEEGKAAAAQREDYEAIDLDRAVKMLEDAPVAINVKPRGKGLDNGAGLVDGAPDGVAQQSYLLDQAIRKKLAEDNRPESDYITVARELQNTGKFEIG